MSRSKKTCTCKNCMIMFHPHYSSYGIYCSLECQYEFIRKTNISKWLGGKMAPLNSNGVIKPFFRKYFIKEHGSKCSLCGWGEINRSTGKVPLEIDHIDGNFRNNDLNNLRLLCPNCHSLTETYKNLNKGHGREKRKGGIK